jgi:hypothetical protein
MERVTIIRVKGISELVANVFPSSLSPFIMMMEANFPPKLYIQEDDILHSHRRRSLKSYIVLTGWTLQRRRDVSPVRYKLRFYIQVDGILHSHRRENLRSCTEWNNALLLLLGRETRPFCLLPVTAILADLSRA